MQLLNNVIKSFRTILTLLDSYSSFGILLVGKTFKVLPLHSRENFSYFVNDFPRVGSAKFICCATLLIISIASSVTSSALSFDTSTLVTVSTVATSSTTTAGVGSVIFLLPLLL